MDTHILSYDYFVAATRPCTLRFGLFFASHHSPHPSLLCVDVVHVVFGVSVGSFISRDMCSFKQMPRREKEQRAPTTTLGRMGGRITWPKTPPNRIKTCKFTDNSNSARAATRSSPSAFAKGGSWWWRTTHEMKRLFACGSGTHIRPPEHYLRPTD